MKQTILFFSLVFFLFFAYTQSRPSTFYSTPVSPALGMDAEWGSDPYATLSRSKHDALSQCKPVRGIDYSENTRKPIEPFVFQKLRFETQYGFYVRVTLDIDASGNTIVDIQDDYYAETTTVKSVIDRNDFTNLLFILARCDFDSFREEKVKNDMKCCNSFFEIAYNDEIKRSRGCAFSPFDNRELEQALWSFIVFKAGHAKAAPQTEY